MSWAVTLARMPILEIRTAPEDEPRYERRGLLSCITSHVYGGRNGNANGGMT